MPVYIDQLGNKIQITKTPLRVISVVPSQSEFLWDIGLRKELIGITKFCIHPEQLFKSVERVGGTKQLDIERIRALKPDLIIANKEENDQMQIELLQKEFPVWLSDIYTIEDACEMMRSLGVIFNKSEKADKLIKDIDVSLARIKNLFQSQRVLYFIWNNPYMVAASSTFVDHILDHLGLQNVAKHFSRYPVLDEKTLIELNPEYCFLSSEPFPFKKKHVNELLQILPNAKIIFVDGELFSWYGSRLLHLEAYVNKLKIEIK